ncbi:MAG: hypothetical protein BWY66_01773 [bacterium ADurb.Bin374]|nr:MAG: hypothetical protein BWY66_01773 [bacterium ADurb.Bin374]
MVPAKRRCESKNGAYALMKVPHRSVYGSSSTVATCCCNARIRLGLASGYGDMMSGGGSGMPFPSISNWGLSSTTKKTFPSTITLV